MQDLLRDFFNTNTIDGHLSFNSEVKDIKCSEPGCFDVVIRTRILNMTEAALLTRSHKQQVYILLKPVSLGDITLEDVTELDLGSENLDIESPNYIVQLKARIMQEYIDQGINQQNVSFSEYLKTRLEILMEMHFGKKPNIEKVIERKPELKARRKAEYQDLVTSEPSEELIDPVY